MLGQFSIAGRLKAVVNRYVAAGLIRIFKYFTEEAVQVTHFFVSGLDDLGSRVVWLQIPVVTKT